MGDPRIVGLDLSLTAVGFCYPGGDTETISVKYKGMERIAELSDLVYMRVVESRADMVVLEDYAFSRAGHAHEIGELGGVVKYRLGQMNQEFALVGPSALKKFATGRGNADKIAMAVAAAKLGREFKDDNQCDAWWLRQMGCYWFSDFFSAEGTEGIVAQTAYRDEAVGKIDWPDIVIARVS